MPTQTMNVQQYLQLDSINPRSIFRGIETMVSNISTTKYLYVSLDSLRIYLSSTAFQTESNVVSVAINPAFTSYSYNKAIEKIVNAYFSYILQDSFNMISCISHKQRSMINKIPSYDMENSNYIVSYRLMATIYCDINLTNFRELNKFFTIANRNNLDYKITQLPQVNLTKLALERA